MEDTTAKGFDHHIDHIMYRGRITPLKETRIGNTVRSRQRSTGLWPSDHGGAFTQLRLR